MMKTADSSDLPDAPDPAEASSPDELIEVCVPTPWYRTEDWCAVWLGAAILLIASIATWGNRPDDQSAWVAQHQAITHRYDQLKSAKTGTAEQYQELRNEVKATEKQIAQNPLSGYVAKFQTWQSNPTESLLVKKGDSQKTIFPALGLTLLFCCFILGLGAKIRGESLRQFLPGFVLIFGLAGGSFLLASQALLKHYNLEYALWALAVGLMISNTIGTPQWMRPALKSELYIKTGLILLGAEILFNQLLALGRPGIFVAWVVTPTVLTLTFIFGQKILKIKSPSLNMVISADMSVCGVSAAIATGAACRAKREEISLAIAMSLVFTVVMMVVMPMAIKAMGMSEVLGGAWIGGTIDSTGAVAAAGGMLGQTALTVAATIKMIQNILIGVVAFAVSIYWVGWVDRTPGAPRVGITEIWRRFPKFMIGFVAVSLIFSYLSSMSIEGEATVSAILSGTSVPMRTWLFCIAFVTIGLETNFSQLMPYLRDGKPLILYVCGQTLNLILTLAMAWLMFEKVFPDAAATLLGI